MKKTILGVAVLSIGVGGYIYYTNSTKEKTITTKPVIEEVKTTIDKPKKNPFNLPTVLKALDAPIAIDAPIPPKVPEVPKAISFNSIGLEDREIGFSKRTPPGYVAHSFDLKQKEKKALNNSLGKESGGRISAYLRGDYIKVETVKSKIKEAGFEIVSTTNIDSEGSLVSIAFTNADILDMASKEDRGFIGTLRVVVDKKENKLSISNPIYMLKGFLQDDFDKTKADIILANIIEKFPNLKNSEDLLKYQIVSKYHFMTGMPYYEDMIDVAIGSNLEEKIKDNKNIVFNKKLNNGSTLIAINISNKFTEVIGRENAALLPYPILIENGKARILNPKYYISFMYPMLSMSKFMEIAKVPDEITKECEEVFN